MSYNSYARWEPHVYQGADGSCISKDTHETNGGAQAVCYLLEKEGFGGEGKHFPLETWTAPTPYEEEYPEEAEMLMDICTERAKKRGKQKPLYLDAVEPMVRDEPKVGRNDPCPCGSNKKYKKCCG